MGCVWVLAGCGGASVEAFSEADNKDSLPADYRFSDEELGKIYLIFKADSKNAADWERFQSRTYEDVVSYYFSGVEADKHESDYNYDWEAYMWHAEDSDAWVGAIIKKNEGTCIGVLGGNHNWQEE